VHVLLLIGLFLLNCYFFDAAATTKYILHKESIHDEEYEDIGKNAANKTVPKPPCCPELVEPTAVPTFLGAL
jgi:hypothetical protein